MRGSQRGSLLFLIKQNVLDNAETSVCLENKNFVNIVIPLLPVFIFTIATKVVYICVATPPALPNNF